MPHFFFYDGIYFSLLISDFGLCLSLFWLRQSGWSFANKATGLFIQSLALCLMSGTYLVSTSTFSLTLGYFIPLASLAAAAGAGFLVSIRSRRDLLFFAVLDLLILLYGIFLSHLKLLDPEYMIYPFTLAAMNLLGFTLGLGAISLLSRFFSKSVRFLGLIVINAAISAALIALPAYFLFDPDDWWACYCVSLAGVMAAAFLCLFKALRPQSQRGFYLGCLLTLLVLFRWSEWWIGPYGTGLTLIALSSGLFFCLPRLEAQKEVESQT